MAREAVDAALEGKPLPIASIATAGVIVAACWIGRVAVPEYAEAAAARRIFQLIMFLATWLLIYGVTQRVFPSSVPEVGGVAKAGSFDGYIEAQRGAQLWRQRIAAMLLAAASVFVYVWAFKW